MDQNDSGNKASTGLQPNLAGLLCYLAGFVTGIIFLIIEKDNKFVRFHAMQSIFVFGGLFVLNIVLSFIPFIGWILIPFVGIAGLILWILLMFKAYNGETYKLPIVGDMAEKQLQKP
jgi:uncharacterized membrane protein